MKRIAVLSLLLAGCLAGQASRQPNVVVIVADQLRGDRLHTYGNSRQTSPNIDAFAAQGVRFEHFYSNAPWSCPSHGTIATSMFPSRHGKTQVALNNIVPFAADAVTMAEIFHAASYGTAAFSNNAVAGAYLLGRGFDLFDSHDGGQNAADTQPAAVNQRMLDWVDKNPSKPFFVYINYWQPHYPYAPPPEHDIFQSGPYVSETAAGYNANNQNLFRWTGTGSAQALERVVQLYDGYIHYLDDGIGQLAQGLKDRGIYDNTIFVLTSDHGELLYSHAKDFLTADHRSLYDAVLKVPAIYWGPGVPQGKVIQAIASHIDTAPTLLDLAGIAPSPSAQGVSLVPTMRGDVAEPHPYVFSESDLEIQERSVRDARYKLIFNVETGVNQLFDTTLDPAEQQDLAAELPEVVNQLSAVLSDWRDQNEPSADVLHSRWASIASPSESIDDGGTTVHLSGGGWSLISQKDTMGSTHFWTPPRADGEALRSITWRTNNQKVGNYRISLQNGTPTGVQVATNTPVTIVTRTGSYSVQVDQTLGRSVWQVLGTFQDPLSVTLTNDANGWVIGGVIKFELVQ